MRTSQDAVPGRTRVHRLAARVAAIAVLCVIGTLLSLHTVSGNSDGATVVLEGRSLAHGNLVLHGWTLSTDSFWTVDVLCYALATLVVGVHAVLLHVVPAILVALIVAVGWKLATLDNPGEHRAAAIVLLVALPLPAFAQFLLAGPYHVGTALYCLVAMRLLAGTPTAVRTVGASLVLAAGTLGDLQTLSLGVAPIAIASLLAMLRSWQWRPGADRLVACIGGALIALGGRAVAEQLGAFTLAPGRTGASFSAALAHVPTGLGYVVNVFGVGHAPFGQGPVPGWLAAAHVPVLLAIAGAVVLTLARLSRGALMTEASTAPFAWELDDMLLLGTLGSLATFAYLATGSPAEARYLTAGIIDATILCARVAVRLPAALLRARVTALVGGIVGAAIIAGAAVTVATPGPNRPVNALVAALRARHLTRGLGGYWSASITTVASGGAIEVRPVITGPSGRVVRYDRQSDAGWYTDLHANFLVFNASVAVDGITRATARATFGRPHRAFAVGPYRVLVYAAPIHVSARGGAA